MSLKTKLIPVLASLGATATMVPCLASCSGLNMETHNMLTEYVNHVFPRLPTTIYGPKEVTKAYLEDAKWFPAILKDDILYTFNTRMKNLQNFPYEFDKYYLYVQNFDIDEEAETVKFSIIIDMAGHLTGSPAITYYEKGDKSKPHVVKDFDLTYTISFEDGFKFERDEESPTESDKDKQFLLTLPYITVTEGAGNATSVAVGYITDNTTDDHIVVSADEKIDFNSGASHYSTAVFYDALFYDVLSPDDTKHTIKLLSHYFKDVNYILS